MKKTIISAAFIFSIQSSATNGFHCVPSLKQTRLQVLETKETIELLVINPMGYDFMPQFDSGGSAFSINFNKMQAEDLNALGSVFKYEWSKNQCSLNSENYEVNCQGQSINKVDKLNSFGLSTSIVTEKTLDQVYNKRKFRLNISNENIYFVNLEFFKESCETFN